MHTLGLGLVFGAAALFVACGGEEFASPSAGGAAGSGGTSSGGSGGSVGGSGGSIAGAGGNVAGAAGGTCLDNDKDQQTTCAGDCNDTDPTVGLGFKEICGDLIDNDCDQQQDEGCNGLGTYVSTTKGNDANNGTKNDPVKTIAEGLNKAAQIRALIGAGVKIELFIGAGKYAEKVTLVEGVSLLGGYQCDTSSCTWARDVANQVSTLAASDFEGVLADSTITRATRLEGLTIQAKDGSPPSGSFGSAAVTLDGGSPTIDQCIILGPKTTGTTWPQARSIGIFIADTNDTKGARIFNNNIDAGTADGWTIGVLLANRPNVPKTTHAEILNNGIYGGAGKKGASGITLSNSGAGAIARANRVAGGKSDGTWAFGIIAGGGAQGTLDANRVNEPGGQGTSCLGAGPCGGIASESSKVVITNNVVFGADATESTGVFLGEFEIPAGMAIVNSNYIDGLGKAASGRSAAVAVAIGDCTTCGFNGIVGRIRNNILAPGLAPVRYGVVELASAGKTIHPEALQNNFFAKPSSGSYLPYGWFNGTASTTLSISNVNAGQIPTTIASDNLEGDPLFDTTSYHLKSGSPCINKGIATEAPAKDRDGEDRPKGGAFDIGPDELE